MTSNERRAVRRAVDSITAQHIQIDGEITIKARQAIPYEAVRLAMLRAGRMYDNNTQREAIDYAKSLV